MVNTYSIIFIIFSLFVYLVNKPEIILENNLKTKLLIFLFLCIINILFEIYNYTKNDNTQLKPTAIKIIKSTIYYSFIGTFAYCIFYDILKLPNIGISSNTNLQILFYSIFITIFIICAKSF